MSPVDKTMLSTNSNEEGQARYVAFLDEAKVKILTVRTNIAKAACKQQIELYTWIGSKILEYQEKYDWGSSAVEKLSHDLTTEFPNSTYGFSPRNLRNMKNFYVEYKDHPQLQELASQIPWGHNLIIMSKVKDLTARAFYLKSTRDMIWTRDFLTLQINNEAYEHQMLDDKQHNFSRTLPDKLALQADQAMKDIYIFETLGLSKPVVEAEMESRMVSKIKDIMLQLGYGFTFIGNQYRLLSPSGAETFIDLLFYNRHLQALVAMELKSGAYKPEYAGRMNYQLSLLDDLVKQPWENPSIGIILCSEKNRIDVEYSLRDINKPVGVSEFKLTKKLPKELSDKLPDPKDLERQIRFELGENENK